MGYHNGAAVRLSDVAGVYDSTQNIRTAGYMDGTRAVFFIIFRQPGANIIQTVDNIKAQLPFLTAVLPQGINVTTVLDRTTTIRASVRLSSERCSARWCWWCWWCSFFCAARAPRSFPALPFRFR